VLLYYCTLRNGKPRRESDLCIVRATQSNFCSTLNFVYPEPCLPNSPELNALIIRFRDSYSSGSMSRESKRLKKSNSWLNSINALIQQLSEKCNFRVFLFCQVVQKHKLFKVANNSCFYLLIACFIGNISLKKYQTPFTCLTVIASQSGTSFETRCIYIRRCGLLLQTYSVVCRSDTVMHPAKKLLNQSRCRFG